MQREAPARTIIRMRDIIKRFYIGTPNELQILNGISLDVRGLLYTSDAADE